MKPVKIKITDDVLRKLNDAKKDSDKKKKSRIEEAAKKLEKLVAHDAGL